MACREHTLPRDENSSEPKGWIRGTPRLGPCWKSQPATCKVRSLGLRDPGLGGARRPAPPLPLEPAAHLPGPPSKNKKVRVCVKASRAQGPRRLHTKVAYAHLGGFSRGVRVFRCSSVWVFKFKRATNHPTRQNLLAQCSGQLFVKHHLSRLCVVAQKRDGKRK